MSGMHKLQLPLLVFHSTADTLTDPDGSKLLVSTAKVSRHSQRCRPALPDGNSIQLVIQHYFGKSHVRRSCKVLEGGAVLGQPPLCPLLNKQHSRLDAAGKYPSCVQARQQGVVTGSRVSKGKEL